MTTNRHYVTNPTFTEKRRLLREMYPSKSTLFRKCSEGKGKVVRNVNNKCENSTEIQERSICTLLHYNTRSHYNITSSNCHLPHVYHCLLRCGMKAGRSEVSRMPPISHLPHLNTPHHPPQSKSIMQPTHLSSHYLPGC